MINLLTIFILFPLSIILFPITTALMVKAIKNISPEGVWLRKNIFLLIIVYIFYMTGVFVLIILLYLFFMYFLGI